jgi:microcompartment protein CcmL/EutN
MDIVKKRLGRMQEAIDFGTADAIGMVQGQMIDMLCAADLAEKAAGIEVFELPGTCPQHMTLILIVGDTASVEQAIEEISAKMKEGVYSVCS